jgi:pyrroline-5-carboxylate reductase
MGEAIVAGLLASGAVESGRIVVVEPDTERRRLLSERHGVACVEAGTDAVERAGTVVFAVKPQVIDDVVAGLAEAVGTAGALVVSIAAGISTARLESLLPLGVPVVRVMPNTPAMVRSGMSVVSGGAEAQDEDVAAVRELFESLGRVVVVDEGLQDVCTALSGSGPAYVAIFADALARAGVRHGLPRGIADTLAVQTMLGTAELLTETGQHPEQLVDAVSSPGGTTIAAVEALEDGGFRAAVADAVAAAVERSRELGS